MQTNIETFKDDLTDLMDQGQLLLVAMQHNCDPESVEKAYGDQWETVRESLPSFKAEYQGWYSSSKAIIKQLLPDRLNDFTRHYEKPSQRKDITLENYRIEDYLQGLHVTRAWENEEVIGPSAAIPHFEQQRAILKSVTKRFENSLHDIRQLVQADLLDSEMASANHLFKRGLLVSAGAVSGVVLEKHLLQVTKNHNVTTRKKAPKVADFNELLKNDDVIATQEWRRIQRLDEIIESCYHNEDKKPSKDEIQELISGVERIIKTLF